jgi:purine-binding chemotaxis protein CheW
MTEAGTGESHRDRELIAFKVGGQEYCVDVKSVREIRGWSPATPIPHAPPSMLGVINLRGVVLPIIDLASRMGFSPASPTSRHVIMVVEHSKQVLGLLVDAVSEIFEVRSEDIQPTPDAASASAKKLVHGVISGEERMISIVSLDEITASACEFTA